MEVNKLYEKLDNLFNEPKSRNFVNHLIKSYLPVTNVEKVWEKPTEKFRCVLSNAPLISVTEVLNGIQSEEFQNDFMTNLKNWESDDYKASSPIQTVLKGRVIGFTGKNTTTFMSNEAYQVFYDWVITKMLKGDKHINWLLNTMKREEFIGRAEKLADTPEMIGAVEEIKSKTKGGKRAMTSLGDFEVLRKLKTKLEGK